MLLFSSQTAVSCNLAHTRLYGLADAVFNFKAHAPVVQLICNVII